MAADPFAPLAGTSLKVVAKAAPARVAVMPVPPGAPAAPTAHPKLGRPTETWVYRDTGGLLGYVHRFDTADGKVFRPCVFFRSINGGEQPAWRWESWPTPRPLYGLTALVERPIAPVVVTEGEKAADAAARLLPGCVVVTSPNGSKSAAKADWSRLSGRDVIIWPDADSAGLEYAKAVELELRLVKARSIATVAPPGNCAVGWDAADALAEGWSEHKAAGFIDAASRPATTESTNETAGRRRPPQRDTLIGLTEFCDLWHDANREAYATFPIAAYRQHWAIRSREFRMWLAGRYYEATGAAIGGQAIEDGIRILEARAVNDGPMIEPFRRVGRAGDALYLDLCDSTWRAVEATSAGWRLIDRPPIKLLRSPAMRVLPAPERGGVVEELRTFLNVRSDHDFILTVAWLVAALRNCGPFPILVVNGEQGSGKSLFSRMLRALVDPSAAPIRAMPKDDRDLVVSAGNSWVLAFDNLSSVPHWLSDALCRLSTGGGFATRMLHTDREEMIFEAQRPILLNGIPMLTDRADLADRAVTVHLTAIPEDRRRPEDELWAAFIAARPRILGALLDAVCAALRDISSVKIDRLPRLADFAKWSVAAGSGSCWDKDAFLAAYETNRRDVSDGAFEADPVAVAVRDYVTSDHVGGWSGTATELLAALNGKISDSIRKSRLWPLHAQALGNRIERIAPLLRGRGFTVERRHSGVRTISIIPPGGQDDVVPPVWPPGDEDVVPL